MTHGEAIVVTLEGPRIAWLRVLPSATGLAFLVSGDRPAGWRRMSNPYRRCEFSQLWAFQI
jgi:hypothetical protein